MAERHISLPKPFSSGDAGEWFKRYDLCCKANGWDEAKQAVKLPTLLEGEALAVWLELSEEQQQDYEASKKEIARAMMPMGFVSLEEFHRRKLRPGEALSLFVHDLKKLLDQAMPDLDKKAREPLLLHQFLAGVPDAVGRQLRASGQIETLKDAADRARLLMTISDQGSDQGQVVAAVPEKEKEIEQLKEQVAILTEQVAALLTSPHTPQGTASQPPRCFSCNKLGHVQRNCPHLQGRPRRCFVCGLPGHIARNCRQGNDKGMLARGSRYPSRH